MRFARCSLGGGFFFVADDNLEQLLVPGAIVGSVGIGCLAAALIHYVLGKAWNMLDAEGQADKARRRKTFE